MQFLAGPWAFRAIVFLGPERIELRDHRFHFVYPSEFVQKVSDDLVQAGAPHGSDASGFRYDPIVDGQRYVQGDSAT